MPNDVSLEVARLCTRERGDSFSVMRGNLGFLNMFGVIVIGINQFTLQSDE